MCNAQRRRSAAAPTAPEARARRLPANPTTGHDSSLLPLRGNTIDDRLQAACACKGAGAVWWSELFGGWAGSITLLTRVYSLFVGSDTVGNEACNYQEEAHGNNCRLMNGCISEYCFRYLVSFSIETARKVIMAIYKSTVYWISTEQLADCEKGKEVHQGDNREDMHDPFW